MVLSDHIAFAASLLSRAQAIPRLLLAGGWRGFPEMFLPFPSRCARRCRAALPGCCPRSLPAAFLAPRAGRGAMLSQDPAGSRSQGSLGTTAALSAGRVGRTRPQAVPQQPGWAEPGLWVQGGCGCLGKRRSPQAPLGLVARAVGKRGAGGSVRSCREKKGRGMMS